MNKFLSLILCLSIILNPAFVQADAGDAYRASGTGGEGKEFYNKLATSSAVAISGANMFTCITLGLSHFVFAGASLDFINGEIDFAKTANAYHQRQLESLRLDDSKLGPHQYVAGEKDLQLPALRAAKAEEENTKSVLEKRRAKVRTTADWYEVAEIWAWTEVLIQSTTCFTIWKSHYYKKIQEAYNVTDQNIAVATAANGLDKAAYLKLLQEQTDEAFKTSVWEVMTGPGKALYFNHAKKGLEDVIKGFDERITLCQTNIDKYNAAIAAFEAQTAPSDTILTGPPTADTVGGGNPSTVPTSNYLKSNLASTNNGRKYVCGGSATNGGVHSSSSPCGGNRIKFSGNMPSFNNGFQASANNGLAFVDATLNGDSAAAGVATATMSANAARMKDIRAAVMKKINDDRLKNGQAKIDFDSLIKEKNKELDKKFAAVAARNGFGPGAGSGSGSGAKAAIDPELAATDAGTGKAATVPAAAGPETPKIDPFASTGSTEAVADPTGLSEAEKDLLATDYNKNKGEYLSNNQDSLFQVLSKTYVRNLDKILVRKKKVLEEAPATGPATE